MVSSWWNSLAREADVLVMSRAAVTILRDIDRLRTARTIRNLLVLYYAFLYPTVSQSDQPYSQRRKSSIIACIFPLRRGNN